MNERERYLATLRFQRPKRITFNPGHGRESTRAAWHTQGLPPDVTDYHAYIRQIIGVSDDAVSHMDRIDYGVAFTMIPEFEEKIIEERADSRVVQDWKGNICEIGKQFTPGNCSQFSAPRVPLIRSCQYGQGWQATVVHADASGSRGRASGRAAA
ncbi:MAG: hypothetical protein QF735_00565 [Phycisphaeraceae bacterium]|nr:hypothetical protein [Phycisphaeraceae bacterium]